MTPVNVVCIAGTVYLVYQMVAGVPISEPAKTGVRGVLLLCLAAWLLYLLIRAWGLL